MSALCLNKLYVFIRTFDSSELNVALVHVTSFLVNRVVCAYVVCAGQTEVAEFLVAKGADVNV